MKRKTQLQYRCKGGGSPSLSKRCFHISHKATCYNTDTNKDQKKKKKEMKERKNSVRITRVLTVNLEVLIFKHVF